MSDHVIEAAKTGRSKCRTCREAIPKGELRFGHWALNDFSGREQHTWYHLLCGVKARSREFRSALLQFEGELPNRDEVEAALIAHYKPPFPYAERAPSGRSSCLHCEERIEKGALRIVVEREVDTGAFTAVRPGYLHVQCAAPFTGDDELGDAVEGNSIGLTDGELGQLHEALG